MLKNEKKRCLEKLDKKVKHHTRETEFHKWWIVYFQNMMVLKDQAMRDLFAKRVKKQVRKFKH